MWGAIIGDIVGSVYEWNNIRSKDFPFFREDNFFTDDSIMTIAVADGLMNGGSIENFTESMQKYGNLYKNADYGGRFRLWLSEEDPQPYNSWGNGSAMRVSPVGFFYKPTDNLQADLDIVHEMAKMSALPTHNHPEGIKGAAATAEAIMIIRSMRKNGSDIDDIKEYVKKYITDKYEYDLSGTIDEIRKTYKFDESCMGTVPVSIIAFLESTGFEDAIRNAISVGGDSDTVAAITGGLAEAAYDIPDDILSKARSYLSPDLLEVVERWENKLKQ